MDPTKLLYGFVVGVVPPLLWLAFWLRENNLHPEPRSTLVKCFFLGMLGVVGAVILQYLTAPLFAPADNFHRYVVWAAIEELMKFGAVYFAAIAYGKMDEPIDAMIYMITAALGFATLENTLFTIGFIGSGTVISTLVSSDLRFIGAILVHVVSSATVGFMLAATFYSSKSLKIIAVTVGLVLATTLHAAFNLSIITSASAEVLKVFVWIWAAAVVLILMFEEIKGIEIRHDKIHTNV